MRNILRKDYRQEEMKYLREAGMSEEQIHRVFVPRTPEEQKKYVQDKANDVEKMKKDIAFLLNEVAELKAVNNVAQGGDQHNEEQQNHPKDGREDALNSMDRIHADKRQQREGELLKAHPDFHPSKRIKDMNEEEIQKALKK